MVTSWYVRAAIQLPAWLHSEVKSWTLETYLLDGRNTDEGGIVTEDGAFNEFLGASYLVFI